MKITKYVHSCLLVETGDRVALFDPGMMSEGALDIEHIERLDDLIITHSHGDHFSLSLVKAIIAKFPDVQITAPSDVVAELSKEGIIASDQPRDGIVFFDAPHEAVEPLFPTPDEIGVHYHDVLSHPGDSHSFTETKAVLALPITAPWGSTVNAVKLALGLKPKYIIPIHDWHWRDEAQLQMYDALTKLFEQNGITFLKPQTAVPLGIDV